MTTLPTFRIRLRTAIDAWTRTTLQSPRCAREFPAAEQDARISRWRADLPSFAQVIVNMILSFGQTGDYKFHIFVDGREVKVKPFFVTQVNSPAE